MSACYQDNCQQTAGAVRRSTNIIAQITVSEFLLQFCQCLSEFMLISQPSLEPGSDPLQLCLPLNLIALFLSASDAEELLYYFTYTNKVAPNLILYFVYSYLFYPWKCNIVSVCVCVSMCLCVCIMCICACLCVYASCVCVFVSQVVEERLVLTEGEASHYLTILSTLPPRLLCNNPADTCSWTITTIFLQPSQDVRCADGRTVPQALIGWVGDDEQDAFCGSQLTDDNWRMGVKVAVSAGLDGLKDGTQERLLRVTAQWLVNAQLTSTVSVGDIPVSLFTTASLLS